MIGEVRLDGVRKVYRRRRGRGRLNSLKGALFHGQLWRPADVDEFVALDGVDLRVEPGEALALIGPNGSGKSTALKLISGILTPTAGTVSTEGRVTALIELGAGFHPEISGRENVIINGMLLGMTREEILDRLEGIVEFAGIGDFIDQPVKCYSSGMYVRLGFAVAVAVDPDILLIDEVLSVGDAAFTTRSLDRLVRMRRDGVSMILVSHDLGLVSRFADRAAYLRKGRLVALGRPDEVVARYEADVGGGRPEPGPEASQPASDRGPDQDGPRRGRWGDGRARITGLELLSNGRPRGLVPSGAAAELRVRYEVSEPIDDFVFGIGWSTKDGTPVAGHNTHLDGWRPRRLEGSGEVRCRYEAIALAPGTYVLDVAIHSEDGRAYDYWCGALEVEVTAPVAWPGIWAPAHQWHGSDPEWDSPIAGSAR